MENDLLTNKKVSALLRDSELAIAQRKEPPVDLRTVPLEQWDRFLDHDVTLPTDVENYLGAESSKMHALTMEEVEAIERQVEGYHGVKSPFYIYISTTLQRLGRPWEYVEEAGRYLTGLTLGKE